MVIIEFLVCVVVLLVCWCAVSMFMRADLLGVRVGIELVVVVVVGAGGAQLPIRQDQGCPAPPGAGQPQLPIRQDPPTTTTTTTTIRVVGLELNWLLLLLLFLLSLSRFGLWR